MTTNQPHHDGRSRLADRIVFWGAVAIALLVTVLA